MPAPEGLYDNKRGYEPGYKFSKNFEAILKYVIDNANQDPAALPAFMDKIYQEYADHLNLFPPRPDANFVILYKVTPETREMYARALKTLILNGADLGKYRTSSLITMFRNIPDELNDEVLSKWFDKNKKNGQLDVDFGNSLLLTILQNTRKNSDNASIVKQNTAIILALVKACPGIDINKREIYAKNRTTLMSEVDMSYEDRLIVQSRTVNFSKGISNAEVTYTFLEMTPLELCLMYSLDDTFKALLKLPEIDVRISKDVYSRSSVQSETRSLLQKAYINQFMKELNTQTNPNKDDLINRYPLLFAPKGETAPISKEKMREHFFNQIMEKVNKAEGAENKLIVLMDEYKALESLAKKFSGKESASAALVDLLGEKQGRNLDRDVKREITRLNNEINPPSPKRTTWFWSREDKKNEVSENTPLLNDKKKPGIN